MSLEVVEPGLLTTVQDGGRVNWTHLGVPVGGACDPLSLAVANLLVGNQRTAAALEMTVVGGTFRVIKPLLVGIAGADLGGHVRESGARFAAGRAHRLDAGWTIAFPGTADQGDGARSYLALAGGVDVPEVLGSRSTALSAGFGGLDGRALRVGDVVQAAEPNRVGRDDATWPADGSDLAGDRPIRVIAGPWPGCGALVEAGWRVGAGSDRVGLRLEGLRIDPGQAAALPSFGVIPGAIQLPADGAPIILLADAQTTGGYPVVAVVIAADLPRVAQLRPGAEVRLEEVPVGVATEALRRQRAALDRGAELLHESSAWDQAWRSAGA